MDGIKQTNKIRLYWIELEKYFIRFEAWLGWGCTETLL